MTIRRRAGTPSIEVGGLVGAPQVFGWEDVDSIGGQIPDVGEVAEGFAVPAEALDGGIHDGVANPPMRTKLTGLSVLVALAVLVSGCAMEADAGLDPERTVTKASIPFDVLPDYQQTILEDGRVTFEEYGQAALMTEECIREYGYEVERVLEQDGFFSFTVSTGATYSGLNEPTAEEEEVSAEQDQVYWACTNRYFSAVQVGWADERYDPTVEERFDQVLKSCLLDAGIDANKPQREILDAYPEVFNACTQEAIDDQSSR